MKTVSKEEYKRRVEKASPPTTVAKNCILAFLFGGAICTIGQALCNLYQNLGLDLPQARTAVSISLIFLSALLTTLGLYDRIAKHAGSGTLVPITGFANSVAAPAIENQAEGDVFGVGCKIFTISGPVILYGVLASWVLGLLYWAGLRLGIFL